MLNKLFFILLILTLAHVRHDHWYVIALPLVADILLAVYAVARQQQENATLARFGIRGNR